MRRSGTVAGGELAVKGGTMLKCSGSNTFPETNVTGNVSGAVLNSLCPRSQNSKWVNVCHLWFKLGTGAVYLGADRKRLRFAGRNHLRLPREYQSQLTSNRKAQIKKRIFRKAYSNSQYPGILHQIAPGRVSASPCRGRDVISQACV